MRITGRILILIVWLIAHAANAAPAFKSFQSRKVQLSGKTSNLLVIVDMNCLEESRRTDKRGHDPLLEGGWRAQHKISRSMNIRAIALTPATTEFNVAQKAKALAQNRCVIGVSENSPTKSDALDPLYGSQKNLGAIAFASGAKLIFHPIWGARKAATVAVIDSGVSFQHEDLKGRTTRTGYDFYNDDDDPEDDFGHGTHVSGLIAASRGNGLGIAGVAGSAAKIMPIKTQGADGMGTMADMVNAVLWAAEHGAQVLNISLSSGSANPALADALEYAVQSGVFVAVAAGNDGQEITTGAFVSPVGYASGINGMMGVGSVDALGFARSIFSNISPAYVEIAAPGETSGAGLVSTFPGNDYVLSKGTSMAAPQVSGAAAAALAFAGTRGASVAPGTLENWIKLSATRDTSNTGYFEEGRRLNLERLGHLLFNIYVMDASGGFDAP